MSQRSILNHIATVAGVAAGGAVLQYLFDPDSGRRRRAIASDKARHARRQLAHNTELFTRDLSNRLRGTSHEIGTRLRNEEVSDETVAQRIRATIGHFSSHPSAIEVKVQDQRVTLSGPVLKKEKKRILWAVATVRGVKGIENNLTPHSHSGDIPGLQGNHKPLPYFILNRRNWPPSYRGIAGCAGAGLAAWGLRRSSTVSGLAGLVGGSLLLTRATANKSLRNVLGIRSGPDVVEIRTSVRINAPVSDVYELWRHPEEFPTFMHNVRQVEALGGDRYRWTVKGPAGLDVSWVAEEHYRDQNREIAWRSLPGSVIEQTGRVRFDSSADDQTIAHVQLSYNPPAGAMGHVIASIFGANPKRELEEDLTRMKTMLETGRNPRDAARKLA